MRVEGSLGALLFVMIVASSRVFREFSLEWSLDIRVDCGSLCGMSVMMVRSLEEAIQRLQVDPTHPVEAMIGGLHVEMRVKEPPSAADLFREIGPWEGESTEELFERFAEERRRGGSGEPPAL